MARTSARSSNSEATCSLSRTGGRKKRQGNWALARLRLLVGRTFPREAFSQYAFSQLIGKSVASYKAYENGWRDLHRSEAERLAGMFGVHANSLLGDAAKKKNAWPSSIVTAQRLTSDDLRWWRTDESDAIPVAAEADADMHAAMAQLLVRTIVDEYSTKSRALLRSARSKQVLGGVQAALDRSMDHIAGEFGVRDEWRRRLRSVEPKESIELKCAQWKMERDAAIAAEAEIRKTLEGTERRLTTVREELAQLEERAREKGLTLD